MLYLSQKWNINKFLDGDEATGYLFFAFKTVDIIYSSSTSTRSIFFLVIFLAEYNISTYPNTHEMCIRTRGKSQVIEHIECALCIGIFWKIVFCAVLVHHSVPSDERNHFLPTNTLPCIQNSSLCSKFCSSSILCYKIYNFFGLRLLELQQYRDTR